MTTGFLAVALGLGGLRDPRLFALGGAAVWGAVWVLRPAPGPAAAWLPWLVWAGVSCAASAQPWAGLPVLARWSAVLAFASLAAAWDERERERWLKTLLAAAGVLAAAALATGAGHGWRNQMAGLLPPYYNYTAFVLAAAVAAAASWLLHPRGPGGRLRRASAAFCLLGLLCLALARSRSAWLGLSAAAAVWAARRWGRCGAVAAALAAALFGGALAGGCLPGSWEALLLKTYRQHAEARPLLWRAAAGIATEAPWLGTGPGNFDVAFRRRPVPLENGAARWMMTTSYAHSEPLQAAGETGWAGLALWLVGAGWALRGLLRREDPEPAREAAAAAAAAMTAQLLVDNMLQIPALAMLWLSACAVCGTRTPRSGSWPRPAAAVGVLLALASWLPARLAAVGPGLGATLFPADPDARQALADRALGRGSQSEADGHLAQAERLAPFNAIYPWRRAQLAAARGDWRRAESLAARAQDLEPLFLGARLIRAEALLRLGRASEARRELEGVGRVLAERGVRSLNSGYERTVWRFSQEDFDRISALAGRAAVGR